MCLCHLQPLHLIRFGFWLSIAHPYSRKNKSRPADFLQELTSFHVDVAENSDSAAFMDVLELFGLQNHVDFATHTSGHTL